ncbi:hypothetical protein CROQUDRAFT_649757 [Cronartium quercuum f. sp. fusiforme G11]|uniref:NAD(P)-binding protein n=1 Tax=Cronartium quercuum f. sp. fusiforme G11 TaxID=708437 RepID=A0A9P6TI39_9BASI|nr:hypothetical protein CROQUDRAFT_649757 [Cronartium quercuum f. sp. fusiforme G11]
MAEILASGCDTLKTYLKANVICRGQRWDARQMPDLSGRVAIVTGGNTGLGFQTCLALVKNNCKVYMASRVESRAKAAITKIKQEVPEAHVEYLYFDLTILSTAKQAADDFKGKEDRLDILINNAGIMMTPYELSPDGIELQACNGTGHFALTMALLPILKKTASLPNTHVRVVNVSSLGHNYYGTPDFTSLDGLNHKAASGWIRYGQSKLTNILFNNELQKLLQDTNIICLAVHPGLVATELTRGLEQSYPQLECLGTFLKTILQWISSTPYAGAQTQLYAATSPEVEETNLRGAYLVPYGQVGRKSKFAQDLDGKLGQEFWSLCEKLVTEAEKR